MLSDFLLLEPFFHLFSFLRIDFDSKVISKVNYVLFLPIEFIIQLFLLLFQLLDLLHLLFLENNRQSL